MALRCRCFGWNLSIDFLSARFVRLCSARFWDVNSVESLAFVYVLLLATTSLSNSLGKLFRVSINFDPMLVSLLVV